MAMKPECIAAVRQAASGRQISDAKLAAIEERLSATMRELARQDRQRWQGLTRDQRMTEAAVKAAEDIQAEAALKQYRANLDILRMAESERRIADHMALNKLTRSQGLVRDLELTENYADAVRNEAISGMTDMIDAAQNRDGTGVLRNLGMRLFDMDNPQMTFDVVREVFRNADGFTGNKAAQAGARAWLDTIEKLRQRFNSAGGNVGKLGYGYLSQAHDRGRVLAAGPDAWAQKVLPLLDREQYVNADGTTMDNAAMLDMLRGAHATIAENGTNKTEPGQFTGSAKRANRGSDHRVLHFRDGEAWMDYMSDFGKGSLYDAMIGHISGMTRDIALVERTGTNPEQWFRVQNDKAMRADKPQGGTTLQEIGDSRSFANTPEAYWNLVSGKAGRPENTLIAHAGQTLRNWQTSAKLGGAVLSSATDMATIAATLKFHRLDYFDMLSNLGNRLKPGSEEVDFLRTHAVIAESLTSSMNRFTGDYMTHTLSGRVAGAVMKVSLMNAWTDGLRGAFAATMMQGYAKKVGTAWKDLDQWDQYLMQRKGITEEDWGVITRATPTDRNGLKYLTAESIRATGDPAAQQAVTKWLAYVNDESQFAVINPDLATRAIVTGGGAPAGTFTGEAWRSFAQFKSFPTAMMTRHWRRIIETPQGLEGAPMGYGAQTSGGALVNRMAVFGALTTTSMLLGALVLQNKSLAQGKDPFNMTEAKFWLRALAQGGGMGFMGDLLLKDPTEQRANTVEQTVGTMAGPAAGAVAGLIGDLGLVNAWEAAKGKETHFGAESLRWINSNLPGANLWYTRAMWEHWILHNLQEAVNPGYLGRVTARAMKDWGQQYWWEPGEAAPQRAPDMGKAVGQ